MAQVRKYATGGGTEKKKETPPTLFHWDGIGDYNVEDLEKTYALEIDNVLSQYDLDEEDKRKIKDRAYLTLQEIKSGRMGNRNANGTWINVTPGFESTGMNEKERKKIFGRSIGKKKYVKDADFYQNLAYDVLDQMIGKTNIYTPPKDQVVTPAKITDFDFGKDLIAYYFYNKQFDPNNWDYINAKTNISSRLAEFKKKVTDSNLSDTDKNDLLGRITQAEAALQTEDPNDDYYGLVRLMSNPKIWFDKNYTITPEARAQIEQEQKVKEEAEKQKAQQTITNTLQNATNNGKETDIDIYYNPATKNTYYGVIRRGLFFPTTSEIGSPLTPFILGNTPTYEGLDSRISWDPSSEDSYSWENFDAARRLMSTGNYEKYREQFDKIKSVFEEYLKLNPEIKLQDLNSSDLFTTYKSLYNIKKNSYNVSIPVDTTARTYMLPDGSVHTYKLGGVLKLQEGGTLADLLNKVNSDPYYKNKQSKKDQDAKKKEESKQKTGFENSDDLHTELSKADKYRIGAIAGDVGSLLLSLTGVGSVASAITGAGSTTANVYADTLEGKSTREAIWDNLGSYALDAVSLLPFAKAAKIPKIIKAISQYTPKITAAIAGIQGLANAKEYLASFNKLTNGEKLTVGDWRNIANGLQIVLGGTAATHRASVGKSNVEAVRSADKVWLKTDQGWKSINQDLAKKLVEAPDLKTQNELLKGTGITLTESLNWRFKGKGKNEIKTTPLYDFNKEAVRYSGDLPIYHTFGIGEKALGNLNIPSINFFNKVPVRNAYNWLFHNQAYRRSKSKGSSKENTPILLALPERGTPSAITKNSSVRPGARIDYTNYNDLYWKRKSPIYNPNTKLVFNENTKKWEILRNKKGGIIFKHQQEGIIKGQGGFRIGAKSKWTLDDRNKALANYNFAGDVQSYLNSGSDIDSYIAAFNGGEDLYDRMVGDTNYFTNMSGNYRKEDPLAYQRQMTFRNTNKGFDDLIRGSIIGYGTTEGASNFDKYLGDRTYNRTLGYLTPEQAAAYNKQINQFGIELFQSPNNKNHYRLRKIPGWINPNKPIGTAEDIIGDVEMPTLPTAEQVLTKSGGTGRNAGLDPEPKNTNSNSNSGNASTAISDLLGLGRLAGTIWTNNRIAKTLKNSLSPLLIDPPQIRRQVMGDLATRTYMENLGAEANRIGSRPITSDASLQLGQALDYNNRANEYRIKGYLADKQAIDRTSLAAQEAAEQNAIARVDAANRNRASMLGIRQAKANIEAQRKSANWSQAVAPWLMDKEYRLRQNNQLLKELDYQEQDYLNRKTLNDSVSEAQDAFNRAKNAYIAAGNEESTWVGSPAYEQALNQLNQAKQKAADIYNQARIKAKKSIYSSPWIMFKSGGKLSYEEKAALEHDKAVNKALLQDSKEFNKIIRESKKENNKLILSLSGLTKELVIKSMTYGG